MNRDQLLHLIGLYRDRLKSVQILLIRTQAGPGRAVKQEQEEHSRNHVQAFKLVSVCLTGQGIEQNRARMLTVEF